MLILSKIESAEGTEGIEQGWADNKSLSVSAVALSKYMASINMVE